MLRSEATQAEYNQRYFPASVYFCAYPAVRSLKYLIGQSQDSATHLHCSNQTSDWGRKLIYVTVNGSEHFRNFHAQPPREFTEDGLKRRTKIQ